MRSRSALSDTSLRRLVGQLRLPPSAVGLRWAFVFGAVFAFGAVARRLHREGSLECDDQLLRWLHSRRSPGLTRAMFGATSLGSVELLTPLSMVVTAALWASRERRTALFFAITAGGSTLINQTLKLIFGRARPDESLHLSRTTGFAFPSGHSMSSAAIYGALAMVLARRSPELAIPAKAACAALIFAVGSSRAYLHVHYPSDVVTGWGLGLAWTASLHGLLPRHAS